MVTAIELPPPPPPPAATPVIATPAPPPPPQRIQVNAEIQEAMLVNMVRPDYPPAAKASRIQGAVHLRAIIDRQGNITELQVIEGHPLLAAAARAAVEKWRYRPTILNGSAVEVATEILVNFRLQ
jgi:protein TonB